MEDEGASGSLEVLALVVLFSVLAAYGTTFLLDPVSGTAPRDESPETLLAMERLSRDALTIWSEVPADDYLALPVELRERFRGKTVLEALVHDELTGGDLLRASFDRVYGSAAHGMGMNLRLCDRIQGRNSCTSLFEDDSDRWRKGTVVTVDKSVDLDYDYVLLRPRISHVGSGTDVPLEALVIRSDRTLPTQVYAKIEAEFLDAPRVAGVRTSLGRGGPLLALTSGGDQLLRTLTPAEVSNGAVFEFGLLASPPSEGSITWEIPRGWEMPSSPLEFPPPRDGWSWSSLPEPSAVSPFSLTLSRVDDGQAPATEFSFKLVPLPAQTRAVDVFPVLYDDGLWGVQEFAVKFPTVPANAVDQRRILTSVPDPLPTDEDAFLGFVVLAGPEGATLERFTVEFPGRVLDPSTVVWWDGGTADLVAMPDGSGFAYEPAVAKVLDPFEAVELAFRARAVEGSVPGLPFGEVDGERYFAGKPLRAPVQGAVSFPANGYAQGLHRVGADAGVLRVDVPAEVDVEFVDPLGILEPETFPFQGWPSPGVGGGEVAVEAAFAFDGLEYEGATSFTVVPLDPDVATGLRDAVDASTLSAEPAVAWAGKTRTVALVVEAESLFTELGSAGVGEVEEVVRVYAPYGLGEATWTHAATESSGVRHGAIASAWGNVDGVPGEEAIVASEDGNVYVLDALTGTEVFTFQGEPGTLLDVEASPDGALLVAYVNGSVAKRVPVTGSATWAHVGGAFQAASVDFGEAPWRAVVGGAEGGVGGVVVLDLATGAKQELASSAPLAPVAVVGIGERTILPARVPWVGAVTENGDVVAWDGFGTEVFHAASYVVAPVELQSQYGLPVEAAVDVLVTDVNGGHPDVAVATSWSRLLVADGDGIVAATAYEPTATAWRPEDGSAVAAFIPDLTGDGVPEVAYASTRGLLVLDTRTRSVLWDVPYEDVGFDDPRRLPCDSDVAEEVFAIVPCTVATLGDRRGLSVTGDGTRAYASWADDDGRARLLAAEAGARTWIQDAGLADANALAAGTHVLGDTYVLLADANGDATLRRATTGAAAWEGTLGDLTGTFRYDLLLPEGLYPGSYAVEIEFTWDDEDALGLPFEQTARLLAAFDVASDDTDDTHRVQHMTWNDDWKRR